IKKTISMLAILVLFFSSSCTSEAKSEPIALGDNSDLNSTSPVVEDSTSENPETNVSDQPAITNENEEFPYDVVYEEQFEIWDPFTEVLSDELLEEIGADGFTGSDEEIALQIFKWQQENMVYVGDPGLQMDVSYQGRWNLFLPGIYPASELIVEHVNKDGKIYAICSDYTLIFSAIANSYGLETRNSAFTKYKFSEVNQFVDPETTRGLALEEYDALNEKLTKHGVNLTYDQIDRVARESYVHQRPEVKINGEWVSFDGAGIAPTGDYLVVENFEALPYYAQYNNVMLYAPPALENGQLNIDHLAELLSNWPQLEYEGVTDDAGNEHRAARFIDLCRGLGLVPYYEDPNKALEFLKIDPANAEEVLDDLLEIMAVYEEGTGKKFYAIADFLAWEDEEMEPSRYVYLYNTITNGDLTEAEFIEYIQ
ncbi:MAG: hypothetical protein KKC20_25410, partial [Proteobacteria bacterium]|nr:hypothetical protein [Pseudomonadota bacterium]